MSESKPYSRCGCDVTYWEVDEFKITCKVHKMSWPKLQDEVTKLRKAADNTHDRFCGKGVDHFRERIHRVMCKLAPDIHGHINDYKYTSGGHFGDTVLCLESAWAFNKQAERKLLKRIERLEYYMGELKAKVGHETSCESNYEPNGDCDCRRAFFNILEVTK